MLVLSRRIGETFVIGDDMEVTVVDITGEKVVLGILAPKSVPITRVDGANHQSKDSQSVNQNSYGRQVKNKLTDGK